MRYAPIAAVMLLAGCPLTSKEITARGERTEFTSTRPPADVAGCVARNADNFMAGTHGNLRPLGDGYEVVVNHISVTAAVVHVRPSGTGSLGYVWTSPTMVTWDLRQVLSRGC